MLNEVYLHIAKKFVSKFYFEIYVKAVFDTILLIDEIQSIIAIHVRKFVLQSLKKLLAAKRLKF